MSTETKPVAFRWEENLPGITTASLLVVTVVSTIVGGFTGMFLQDTMAPAYVAVAAGLAGTALAGIVRNTILIRAWDTAGVADAGTPIAVVVYAAVASLAGSLAAYVLASGVGQLASIVTGMLAGLLSAVFLGLLMLAYRMQPERDDSDR